MLSRFLPDTFDFNKPVAVISGKGVYPYLTVSALRSAGVSVRLLAFEDETPQELVDSFPAEERIWLKVGQIGKMLKALEKFQVGSALMVGQITPRRLFRGLHLDLKTAITFAKLKKRNAETIFGAIAAEIEKIGVSLLDARSFLDSCVVEPGVLTGGKLKIDPEYIKHGIQIAKEMARLDVGQGVVVRKGTVLAVEAFEGTDAMLRRAGEFEAKGSIFIKTVKPKQDFRFDVPVFGMNTVKVMAESGLYYAGLEAGSTLILEKEKVLEEARRQKITIFAYNPADYL